MAHGAGESFMRGKRLLGEQLRSKQSPKRRSAAPKLRKPGNPAAGPALFDALKHALGDPKNLGDAVPSGCTAFLLFVVLNRPRLFIVRPGLLGNLSWLSPPESVEGLSGYLSLREQRIGK